MSIDELVNGEMVLVFEEVTLSWHPRVDEEGDVEAVVTVWKPDVGAGEPCGSMLGSFTLSDAYLRFMRSIIDHNRPA